MSACLLEFQPFPQSPTFLPANVIEGKQSSQLRHNLPDKTHIYHMANLCGLLCLRSEQTEGEKLANDGSLSQGNLGVILSGCGVALKHVEGEWDALLSGRSEFLLWKARVTFKIVASIQINLQCVTCKSKSIYAKLYMYFYTY